MKNLPPARSLAWLLVAACQSACNSGSQEALGPGSTGSAGGAAPAEAQLVLPPVTQWDFGKVLEGGLLSHSFEFAVAGSTPLEVVAVQKSCGCTRAELLVLGEHGQATPYTPNVPIPAGARLRLDADFDTLGRTGLQSKPISLYANLPQGRQEFALLADVQPFLVAEPATLDLGRFLAGEQPTAQAILRAAGDRRMTLSPASEGITPELGYELRALDPDATGRATRFSLEVRAAPSMLVGLRNLPLAFESDLTADGSPLVGDRSLALRARVDVRAEVLALVEARPPAAAFGVLAAGVAAERSVEVNLRVAGVDLAACVARFELGLGPTPIPEGTFRYTLDPLEASGAGEPPVLRSYRLRISTDGLPEGLSGTLAGSLTFDLGLPAQPQFRVGVTAVARGR